jgi:radical SAM protein (TIGR01212 family)
MSYNSLSDHLKARFGCKVYKLALEGGMTCPNRDGTCGTGGCIFCGADGSGAFAQSGETVFSQIEAAKSRVSAKIKDGRYIAYFQNFTNTYAPVSYLEPLFRAAISHPDVAILSIATRPDCLPEDVLDLLEELNRDKPVWVELGLQTIHPDTARYIRRGYELPVYDRAVEALHRRGIEVITHVILGLPGENRQQMLETVEYVGQVTDGIKLQLLHVLRGTDLAADYENGLFSVMEPEEYCSLIADCIRVLPRSVVIHRLTGDGAKKDLIAPLWTGDKKRVLNLLHTTLAEVQQGEGLTKKDSVI